MTASPVAVKFQIGARTIVTASRRLVRIGLSLDEALACHVPALPPLAPADQGWLLTSIPAGTIPPRAGSLAFVRQHYRRHYVDLAAGKSRWLAGMSASTRNGLRRKMKRMEVASGGGLDIVRFRTPHEVTDFHASARSLSAVTYQERLLGARLPSDPSALVAAAGTDRVRAWLLRLNARPVAYLCCVADGDTLRYEHVGHDPAFAGVSPGTVLLAAALDELFADRFVRFDFTEGEGQHKRTLATGSVPCADLLLLRPTVANRVLIAALRGFDRLVAVGKRFSSLPGLAPLAHRVRRAT